VSQVPKAGGGDVNICRDGRTRDDRRRRSGTSILAPLRGPCMWPKELVALARLPCCHSGLVRAPSSSQLPVPWSALHCFVLA